MLKQQWETLDLGKYWESSGKLAAGLCVEFLGVKRKHSCQGQKPAANEQRNDPYMKMFFARTHLALLLFLLFGLLVIFHVFNSSFTVLSWASVKKSGLWKSGRLPGQTWDERQKARQIRLAKVCQQNKGRTRSIVDPDRFSSFCHALITFLWLFPFPVADSFTNLAATSFGAMLRRRAPQHTSG